MTLNAFSVALRRRFLAFFSWDFMEAWQKARKWRERRREKEQKTKNKRKTRKTKKTKKSHQRKDNGIKQKKRGQDGGYWRFSHQGRALLPQTGVHDEKATKRGGFHDGRPCLNSQKAFLGETLRKGPMGDDESTLNDIFPSPEWG